MLKQVFEVRLIRIEGIPIFSTCDIYLDNNHLERLYPSDSTKIFPVNCVGTYQLLIKHLCTVYSRSFCIDLFSGDGMLWIPLLKDSQHNDFIHTLPDRVQEPKGLLLIQKKAIEECIDTKEKFKLSLDDFEIFNEAKPYSLTNSPIGLKSVKKHKIEEKKMPVAVKISKEFIEVQNKEKGKVQDTREAQSKEEEWIRSAREADINDKKSRKITKEKKEVQDAAINFQEDFSRLRDSAVNTIAQIEVIDKSLSIAFSDILYLNLEIQKRELENASLKGNCNKYISEIITELVQELSKQKEKLTSLEQRSQSSINKRLSTNESIAESNTIQTLLDIECKKLNIKPLSKAEEAVYKYGNEVVNISIQGGKLMCRIGDIYREFKQHMIKLASSHSLSSLSLLKNHHSSSFQSTEELQRIAIPNRKNSVFSKKHKSLYKEIEKKIIASK